MVKPKEFNPEIGKRIRKAINYIVFIEDLANQRDVAELVGKDKDNLSKALKGDTTYTGIYIEAICSKYSTFNKEWFYTGNGDMLGKGFPLPALLLLIKTLRYLTYVYVQGKDRV